MRGIKALTLCAVLAALLCACSGGKEAPPEQGPSESGAGPLLTVAGVNVGRGEIGYLLSYVVEEYYMVRDIDWDGAVGGTPMRRYFLEQVLERAVEAHVTDLKAGELGYTLTDEEKDAIDWGVAIETDNYGGRDAFLAALAGYGLTEDQYRLYNYTVHALREKMIEGLFGKDGQFAPDEKAVWDYYTRNYISASYIFLSGTDAYGEPMEDGDWALQKSVAEALRRQAAELSSVEEFFEMVEVYDQSYHMMLSPEGMPIPRGMLGEGFDAALSALGEGDVSPVVVTEEGFYIILRLPEDLEWFLENKDGIWYACAYEAFSVRVQEWGREMGVDFSDAFWALDPQEMMAMG